jgi:hypothetical protein
VVEVTADSLYEAVAQGLRAFRENDWVDDVGGGLTTITVVVSQPAVEHKVRVRDFEQWLEAQGRTPAEMSLKSRLRGLMRKPRKPCKWSLVALFGSLRSITDGLKPGERVIVNGMQSAQSGAKVIPHEAPFSAESLAASESMAAATSPTEQDHPAIRTAARSNSHRNRRAQ